MRHIKSALVLHNIAFILSAILLFILTKAFITTDLSFENIFLFSSSIQPLIYKIGALWSSNQGSLFFFFFLCFANNFIYINYLGKKICNTQELLIILSVSTIFCLILASNLYFFSNPFLPMKSKVSQGLGLNPLLQDIALVIHPPILYLGYITLFTPFVLGILSLKYPQNTRKYLPHILLYSRISWLALTIGISLGSWWAYRELGWGGYWFFDPVENASLLPWLIVTPLYHMCKRGVKLEHHHRMTIILSILGFIIVLISTMLVRSGWLISVHSFAQNKYASIYLLASFTVFICPCLYFLLSKIRFVNSNSISLSKPDKLVYTANILFSTSAVIILLSLIAPPLLEYYFNQQLTIEPRFFIYSLVPIFLVLAAMMTYLWFPYGIYKILPITIFVTFLACYLQTIYHLNFIAVLASLISICLLITSLLKFIYLTANAKLTISKSSMIFGHSGYAMLILAICLNNLLHREFDFFGKIGEIKYFDNVEIKLQNVRYKEQNNYYQHIADFWVKFPDANEVIISPENRFYKIEQSLAAEVAIKHFYLYDLYVVLSGSREDNIEAKFYIKPLMLLLWLSCGTISIAIALSFISKRNPKAS
ncbi:MAG: cytochrome c biogenesis protein CcsA [Rickettsiaceae bacterium]|nr:cytochrome c biogenesis protein CcsA [Rickettsiaceae bacterium]